MWQFQKNLTCKDERTSFFQAYRKGPGRPAAPLLFGMLWHWKFSTSCGAWDRIMKPCIWGPILKKKKKSYKKLQRELAQLVTVSKQTKARKAGQHKFSPENRGCKCPLAKRDSVDPKQEIWETEINFVKLLWFLISTLWRKFKQQGTFPSCPAFSHWGSIYFQWILLKLPPRLTDPTSHWCLFPHPIFLRNMKESSSPSADKERLQTWWASQN